MDDFARCLNWFTDNYATTVVVRQTTVEQQYEGFALLAILGAVLNSGYASPQALDFRTYSTIRKRDVTDGGRRDRSLRPETLIRAFTPQVVLRRASEILSIYYQGYPIISSELRPDIAILRGEVCAEVRPVFAGRVVSVSYRQDEDHDWSDIRLVELVAGPQGPLEHYLSKRVVVRPDLLVEVTTDKTPGRTRDQLDSYITTFRPKHIGFLHQQSFRPSNTQGLLFSFQNVRPDTDILRQVIRSIGKSIGSAGIV